TTSYRRTAPIPWLPPSTSLCPYTTLFRSFLLIFASCEETSTTNSSATPASDREFADLQVLTYEVPGWDNLDDKQKELAYYLYERSEERRVGKSVDLGGGCIIEKKNKRHDE